MPDVHAVLSPSSAHRWLECTPSAMIEKDLPDTTSEAAKEGTLAHAIVEAKLKSVIDKGERCAVPKKLKKDSLFFPAMEDYCDQYVDYVLELLNEARKKTPDAFIASETKVDFSRWVENGFGTADTTIIADGKMYVIDFKFGKGVVVEAEDNPQLKLYALGCYDYYSLLYDIDEVEMIIVQPRADGITSASMAVADLLEWADTFVKPRAELASRGDGEKVTGSHCLFCRAKNICAARAVELLDVLKNMKEPGLMTPKQIAEVLPKADALASWAKSLKEYALNEAMNGNTIPGYKIVAGRSLRVITDEKEASNILMKHGCKSSDIFDLKGITNLERSVGKKELAELLGDLIQKPEGKPTLVPNSDKREAINDQSYESIFND